MLYFIFPLKAAVWQSKAQIKCISDNLVRERLFLIFSIYNPGHASSIFSLSELFQMCQMS